MTVRSLYQDRHTIDAKTSVLNFRSAETYFTSGKFRYFTCYIFQFQDQLCDRYGLYMIDEANIESHGMGYGPASLAKDSTWLPAHIGSIQRHIVFHPGRKCFSQFRHTGTDVFRNIQ